MVERQDSLEVDLTTCQACHKTFLEPKLLMCLDTFCYKCLEQSSFECESIVCPTCGALTTIPDGGLRSLPDNSFVATIIHLKKLDEEQKNRKAACSACLRQSPAETTELQAVAVAYCVACEDKLCKTCSDAHRKLKMTTDHRLVPLDSDFMTKLSEARQSRPTYCQEHSDQACTLYGRNTDCQKPICLKCALLAHKTHEYKDICDVSKHMRTQLLEVAEKLREELDSLDRQYRDIETRGDAIQKSRKDVEQLLDNRLGVLRNVIEDGRKELIVSAQDIHGRNMRTLQDAEKALNTKQSDLENALAFGQVLSRKGNAVEIGDTFRLVQLKADQLRTSRREATPGNLETRLAFNVDLHDDEILNHASRTLGSIFKTQTERIGEIRGRDPVRGIAIVGDQLFIVHRSYSSVDIYSADSLAYSETFHVEGLTDPTDMAACSTTKKIYISEKSSSKMFCAKIGSVKRIAVVRQLERKPFGVSVMPNTNVLAAHGNNECFTEFTADWREVRVIETPGEWPVHVVFLTDNCFVTSGGDWSSSVCIYRVDESTAGDEHAVSVCEHELAIFKRPTHIAVDAGGVIFVADSHRHRIVMTDSKLSSAVCTYSDYHTTGLDKVCLSADSSKLYIGINGANNNIAAVYRIRY